MPHLPTLQQFPSSEFQYQKVGTTRPGFSLSFQACFMMFCLVLAVRMAYGEQPTSSLRAPAQLSLP